jgi:hypothetical protein
MKGAPADDRSADAYIKKQFAKKLQKLQIRVSKNGMADTLVSSEEKRWCAAVENADTPQEYAALMAELAQAIEPEFMKPPIPGKGEGWVLSGYHIGTGTVRVFHPGFCRVRVRLIGCCCTVRVSDRNLHSRMPLDPMPLLRLKLLHACDQ